LGKEGREQEREEREKKAGRKMRREREKGKGEEEREEEGKGEGKGELEREGEWERERGGEKDWGQLWSSLLYRDSGARFFVRVFASNSSFGGPKRKTAWNKFEFWNSSLQLWNREYKKINMYGA
jgi:hypothetical protein